MEYCHFVTGIIICCPSDCFLATRLFSRAGSAQQDLCFQSPATDKGNNNNPVTVIRAECRLIALLRSEAQLLFCTGEKESLCFVDAK